MKPPVLHKFTFRAGYYDTDEHSYPDGALAPGSSNYFITAQDALRPYKGSNAVAQDVGGTHMFQVAGGYGALHPRTMAVGSVTLTGGASGSVTGITVAGTEIMSGAEAFDADLSTTATNVAANINAFASEFNYGAIANGATVHIIATVGGASANGDAVVSSTTTITTTDVNMAGGVTPAVTDVTGSMTNFINESLFFIGSGSVIYNGQPLIGLDGNPFVASSSLQLSLKDSSGTYSTPYTAGMAQPSSPTVAVKTPGAGFTGQLTGVYSFKIARVRSATGGRSIASPSSATITADEQTALLTFPAVDSNGQDRWAIFATRAGFGGVGVHYLYDEIDETDLGTVDGIARSIEIEFTDADLLPEFAWIDDYPPPAAAFAGTLENYMLVIGCYDNAIAASVRNFPESYNPNHLAYLPESPTAVLPDQVGSYLYVATENSVHALSITFAENPLAIQTLWSDIGIKKPHNWTAVQGRIFAFVSEQGAVMMDAFGQPSNEFSIPVANAMENWSVDDVRVFHAPKLNSVVYTYQDEVFAYNYQINKWSPPIDTFGLGSVISGVVVDRALYVTTLAIGSRYRVYEFDVDNGSDDVICQAVTPYISFDEGRMDIDGIKAKLANSTNNTATIKLEFDYSASGSKSLAYSAVAGTNTTPRTRWFLPRKEAVRCSVTQTYTHQNDTHPIWVTLFGITQDSEEL